MAIRPLAVVDNRGVRVGSAGKKLELGRDVWKGPGLARVNAVAGEARKKESAISNRWKGASL